MKRQTDRIVLSSCWEQLRTGKWQRLSLALLVAVMTMTTQTAWAGDGEPIVLPEGTIYVSESGNDENDGLSEENPIATLAHAVEMAKSKENKTATVYVLNGEYTTGAIDIGNDVGVSLSIIGQEKGEVVIHGTGAYIFDVYGDDLVWSFKNLVFDGIESTARTSAALVLYSENTTQTSPSPKGNFTIDNCIFRNINSKLGAIAIGNDYGNTKVTNCIIENVTGSASSTAILTVNGDGTYTLDNIEIKNCRLDEDVASSTTSSYLRSVIYVNTLEADVTISNSKIYNNNGPTMSLIESRSKLTIVNTTISDNVVNTSANEANGGDVLIWASNDNSIINISQCKITGNTIAKSGKGMFFNQRGSMNVEYSDISGNTVDAFIGSTGTITANNNWWGTNDQPDTKVGNWVIMNVDVDDSDLAENNKLTLTIDFNHVKTSSGNIEELTSGEIPKEIPKESYTVEATAKNGEITPSRVVVNKGETKSQTFTVTEISDVITLTCDGDAVPITIVPPNYVTQDNFYSFFDADGKLLDAITFNELIFQGNFSNSNNELVPCITIDRAITITGDNAVLNDMAFIIAADDVTLDNLTLVANSYLGNLIDIACNNVVISDCDITYVVEEPASVINLYPDVNNVQISNNTIHFESHIDSDEDLVNVINLDGVEDVIVDGNTIDASMPSLDINFGNYDWNYFMGGLTYVNPIRVFESHGVELTNNKVDVTVNSCDATCPTVQALYIVGSKGVLVEGNDLKLVDTLTPEGLPIYLYAVQCGFSEEIEFIENNFNISTAGGQSGAGTAYVIQTCSAEATFIGNNITCESNCSSLGIYNFPPYVSGEAKDLVIEDNLINVTGLVPESNTWALISGIEIQTGYAFIKNNTIYVQNKGEYADNNPVSGISAIQNSGSTFSFDIQDNEILVPDGKYAVEMLYAPSEATVTGNILCAHELNGDDAVYIADGNDYKVENNYLTAKEVTVDEQTDYWTTFYCGVSGLTFDDATNACAYTATYEVVNEVGTITLHKLGQVIPKGTAVIIVSEDEYIDLKISTAEAENTVGNNLHGVDMPTALSKVKKSLDADAILVLANKGENFGFHELATTNVPARKAFLALSGEAALAREFTMVFEDATGIGHTEITESTEKAGAWYSLDGRRLSGKPVKSGVYVKNGIKVVIK